MDAEIEEGKPERGNPAKPIHEIRLGRIKAAVWENPGEDGPWYKVQIARLYKDDEGWRSTTSYAPEDLLLVAKVADTVHTWLLELGKA